MRDQPTDAAKSFGQTLRDAASDNRGSEKTEKSESSGGDSNVDRPAATGAVQREDPATAHVEDGGDTSEPVESGDSDTANAGESAGVRSEESGVGSAQRRAEVAQPNAQPAQTLPSERAADVRVSSDTTGAASVSTEGGTQAPNRDGGGAGVDVPLPVPVANEASDQSRRTVGEVGVADAASERVSDTQRATAETAVHRTAPSDSAAASRDQGRGSKDVARPAPTPVEHDVRLDRSTDVRGAEPRVEQPRSRSGHAQPVRVESTGAARPEGASAQVIHAPVTDDVQPGQRIASAAAAQAAVVQSRVNDESQGRDTRSTRPPALPNVAPVADAGQNGPAGGVPIAHASASPSIAGDAPMLNLAGDAEIHQPRVEALTTERVVRGLTTMIKQNGGVMHLRLNPPELGDVSVRMSVVRGVVEAQFNAGTIEAQAILEKNIGTLRSALESQGLTVERLTVHPSANQGHAGTLNDGQDQSQQQQRHHAGDGESRGKGEQHHRDGSAQESFDRDSFDQFVREMTAGGSHEPDAVGGIAA